MNQRLRDAFIWFSSNRIWGRFRIVDILRRYRLHRFMTAGLMLILLYAPALAASNVQTLFTNEPETQGYQLGDFDGDGVTDVFRVVGSQWQYAPGGVGTWRDLASDSTPLGDLRFGDFNGDGVTDVFRLIPDGGTNQWQVSWGGRTAWVDRADDPLPLADLRFGDFDGDGRTDVFSLNGGGQWVYSSGGAEAWRNLAAEASTALADLRFGDFDGDGRTDVFRLMWTGATYQWQYSAGGASGWQNLAADPSAIGDLRFADLNGDGFTDIFRSVGNQWQYSPGARLPWVNLAADSTPIGGLRFGDFDGDGIGDVFNVAGGQLRYSAGGVRAWAQLVPGSRAIYDLRFGDFNNDGVTDVFRAVWTGTTYQWQYSPGGVGAWENLATDPTPIDLLRFGDFNGDGYTDAFRLIPDGGTNQWQFSSRARDPWQNLATDPALLSELRFGDFNGDGRTDVFGVVRQTDGGGNFTTYQWRYVPGGVGGWQNLTSDPTPLVRLRFGYFDANATTDVFSAQRIGATYNDATYQWRYSEAGIGVWQPLTTDPRNITGLRFADLDGNGITDVFGVVREPATYQWRMARDARNAWQNLAGDSTPPSELRFGDFNGDNRIDVFGIAPDGRWRYSPGGTGEWILLGPPTDSTATPTVTPTPESPPCDPNYAGACIPVVSYDLNCDDIPFSSFRVVGTDRHNFDADGDGIGCELDPTPTPTGHIPPPSPSCNNILANGDFEQNSVWTFGNSPIPAKYTSIQRRGGARAVQLGNPPDSGHGDQLSYSSIRQSVMVPRHATSVQLRWWHYYQSAEGSNPNPGSSQDRQEVILLTPQGNTLQILSRILRNDGGWQQSVIDLSEYAGQSFHIYFNVYNDGNGARTWMYLDDVELTVCGGEGGPHPAPYKPPVNNPPAYQPPGYQPPAYQPPYQGPPANYRPPTDYRPQPYKPGMGQPHPPGEPTPVDTPEPESEEAFVVSVVTGDTIVVRIGGVDYTVRYLGIDAPDLNEDFGDEAVGLNDFLVAGNIVYLERDESDTDRFGRLLRYVFLDDGTFVNLELVRMGLARATDSAPDSQYLADLLQAEIEAREAEVGIWSSSDNNDSNGAGLEENGDSDELGLVQPQSDLSGQSLIGPEALAEPLPDTMPDTMSATPTPGPLDSSTRGNGETPGTDATNAIGGFEPADTSQTLQADANGDPIALAVPQLVAPILPEPDAGEDVDSAPESGAAIVADMPFVEPDQCLELVNNGAFEVPDTGWNLLTGAIMPEYSTSRVFNESRFALRLGIDAGENLPGVSAVDQLINLPASADSIMLSFRYLPVFSDEPGPGDLQYVDVYNGLTGQFAGRVLSEQRNADNWLPVNYDLTHLAGQPVRLVFAVNNDGVAGTIGMYVDHVSIWACNLAHLASPNQDANGVDSANGDASGDWTVPPITTPTAAPESSSSSLSSQNSSSGELRSWADRLGTVLIMGGIFGAIALATIVAVGVRHARRAG